MELFALWPFKSVAAHPGTGIGPLSDCRCTCHELSTKPKAHHGNTQWICSNRLANGVPLTVRLTELPISNMLIAKLCWNLLVIITD